MRTLLLPLLIVLAGCHFSAHAIGQPSYEKIVAQFEATAFGSDFGSGRNVVLKWTHAPRLHILGNDRALILDHSADIRAALETFGTISGRQVALENDQSKANYVLVFTAQENYAAILARFSIDPTVLSFLQSNVQHSICAVILGPGLSDSDGIDGAIILIDENSPKFIRRVCIYEEIFQSAGLPADACHFRPSLFCESDKRQVEPTPADLILLRTLYDSRLKPGMTREEAMPIAREIIRELWRD